jgi:hypothetical protein
VDLSQCVWVLSGTPKVQAEEEAGSQRHLVSRPIESRWNFRYESHRLWVWSLEMVPRQRCGEYTYEQGELRGIVGDVRKRTDVPLQGQQ